MPPKTLNNSSTPPLNSTVLMEGEDQSQDPVAELAEDPEVVLENLIPLDLEATSAAVRPEGVIRTLYQALPTGPWSFTIPDWSNRQQMQEYNPEEPQMIQQWTHQVPQQAEPPAPSGTLAPSGTWQEGYHPEVPAHRFLFRKNSPLPDLLPNWEDQLTEAEVEEVESRCPQLNHCEWQMPYCICRLGQRDELATWNREAYMRDYHIQKIQNQAMVDLHEEFQSDVNSSIIKVSEWMMRNNMGIQKVEGTARSIRPTTVTELEEEMAVVGTQAEYEQQIFTNT